MGTPINKEYLDEIDLRLKQITKENEYTDTIITVERAQLKPFKGYDLPAVNYWPTSVSNAVKDYDYDSREINLIVEAHTKTRDEPFTDVCDRLAADIITGLNRATKAPKVSDEKSLDLGDLVEGFNNLGYDYQIGQGQDPFCGIIMTFSVKFSTSITNMFS